MKWFRRRPAPPRILYWRQDERERNFGDAITELLLDLFEPDGLAPGDAYLLVGSVLDDGWLRKATDGLDAGRVVHAWGCGWRGTPIRPDLRRRTVVHAVRGPGTRDGLGLPAAIPLGDSGLLLPLLHDPAPRRGVGAVLAPHWHDPRRLAPPAEALAGTGCDTLLTPVVTSTDEMRRFIDTIAGAEIVLAGAMHAAITAAAYGVPFAFFAGEGPDVPAKWQDFAASIGVPAEFVADADAALAWADRVGPSLRLPPLGPLLDAAPGPVRPEVRRRAGERVSP